MMVMATGIIISLTVLLSVFVNFAPNLHQIVNNDFLRRAYYNSNLYGLQRGQLALRSGRLTSSPGSNTIDINQTGDYIFKGASVAEGNIKSTISYTRDRKTDPYKLNVTNTYESTAPTPPGG